MPSINIESRIDFLGIGAQKAATSWLVQQLRNHPRFWIPPRKGLHYFDRDPSYPSPSHLATSNLLRRIYIANPWKDIPRLKDTRNIPWLLRYHLMPVNDTWYHSLFREGQGKIKGEITPAYSILNPQDVSRIRRVAPELKIIFLLRNPIDRAWSQYCYQYAGRLTAHYRNESAIKEFIDSDMQCLRSDYLRSLDIWGSQFDAKQLYIGYYDDICIDPSTALQRIFCFLGEKSLVLPEKTILQRRVNASINIEMPAAIRMHLTRKYCQPLRELAALLGRHAIRWAAEAEAILDCRKQEDKAAYRIACGKAANT
jgi:hypothetical protein